MLVDIYVQPKRVGMCDVRIAETVVLCMAKRCLVMFGEFSVLHYDLGMT